MDLTNEPVTPLDKKALKKIGKVPPNFRLYYWGWVELHPPFHNFLVKGAEFRTAKSGPRKGQLCIKVPNTERQARFTAAQVKACYAAAK